MPRPDPRATPPVADNRPPPVSSHDVALCTIEGTRRVLVALPHALGDGGWSISCPCFLEAVLPHNGLPVSTLGCGSTGGVLLLRLVVLFKLPTVLMTDFSFLEAFLEACNSGDRSQAVDIDNA